MIGQGKFSADVARGFELLTQLGVGSYRNFRPNTERSTTDFLRSSESYVELYQRYLSCQAFDILLDDGSMMFFRRNLLDKTLLSYGYLEFPYVGVSYNAFVADMGGDVGEVDLWEEYEDYRSQLPLRPHVIPIRYDWSPALYREGAHPASHLHLGHDTDVRLAVDALLTPVQFILFVVRHFYVDVWEKQACDYREVLNEVSAISDGDVVQEYRKGRDLLELRLVSIINARARSVQIHAKPR
jgi:hypothetical protein